MNLVRLCWVRAFSKAVALGVLLCAAPLCAIDIAFSGLFDSKLSLGAGAGKHFDGSGNDQPPVIYGFEEYLNLRLRASVRNHTTFNAAFNVIAAGGMNALALGALESPAVVASARNYLAAIELERLYFRTNTRIADIEAGLMRTAFGYSAVWSPMDFLNPKNPLIPDARARAALAATVTAYPGEVTRVQAFFAAPEHPLEYDAGGIKLGAAVSHAWRKVSAQLLYAGELPREKSAAFYGTPYGVHRFGASVKADVKVGITAEALFSLDTGLDYDGYERKALEALSLSAGADYSFFDGNLIVLAEYLFNGARSGTASSAENAAGFLGTHYLYASGTYAIDDYTSVSLACMANFSDYSWTPLVSFQKEILQGLTLSAAARFPLDRAAFGMEDTAGNPLHGELGPERSGARFLGEVKLRVRL